MPYTAHTGSSCATITTNSEMAVPNRGFTRLSPYLTFLEPPVVKGEVPFICVGVGFS